MIGIQSQPSTSTSIRLTTVRASLPRTTGGGLPG